MLALRQSEILETIVRDYIAQATPVSSRRVLQVGEFDLSPASIRTIMGELEDENYIFQPHTSAGRVPTQKGYRFFVDHIMSQDEALSAHTATRLKEAENIHEALKVIAEELHLFTLAALPGYNAPANFGMRELFRSPEFQDTTLVSDFGKLADAIFEKYIAYENALSQHPFAIFIEKENVIPEARRVSVLAARVDDDGVLLAIGPARMNYEHAACVLKLSATILKRLIHD